MDNKYCCFWIKGGHSTFYRHHNNKPTERKKMYFCKLSL